MGCPALTYEHFSSVEAEPKSAHRRNANKNITELLDDTGTVRAHYEYSPFGKITAMTGDKGADNPFRFSSEYHDDETALVYYNYRYYSPELGRWLKRDPIEERGGVNLYGMVGNNAVEMNDIRGLITSKGKDVVYMTSETDFFGPPLDREGEPCTPGNFTFLGVAAAHGGNKNYIPVGADIKLVGQAISPRYSWSTCRRNIGRYWANRSLVAGYAPDISNRLAPFLITAYPIRSLWEATFINSGEWMWLYFDVMFLYCPKDKCIWTRTPKFRIHRNGATPRNSGWELDRGGYGLNIQTLRLDYDCKTNKINPSTF